MGLTSKVSEAKEAKCKVFKVGKRKSVEVRELIPQLNSRLPVVSSESLYFHEVAIDPPSVKEHGWMKMEQSLSSLAFRGSILEAIAEAKQQKKLFVVYTSSDNPESKLLETSTWIDPSVSEVLSKYCILLHILEGSSEASNFSAIYPQHSAPCITAIGYNGVQLWQKEGFVSADVLASSLEKAWLSLHVQETNSKGVGVASTEPSLSSRERDKSISEIGAGNTSHDPMERGQNNPKVAYPVPENNLSISDNHLDSSNEVFHEISNEADEVAHVRTEETREVEKDDTPASSAIKSNDVFLNIRLPDGSSLQVKFSVNDTLQMVKDYIHGNQSSSFGSFTLAIPYPRKVFSDQGML
ncbi:UNVERIFIED_CONTAM: Plant UBX domain-containing protein 11 [Sesamum radiatum]|uniref:Plant UBX domain-containing protein 11 n=1 Tax=Sesamum radiatum TaxID=300843 RepID=A0AAW2QFR3_SESRA